MSAEASGYVWRFSPYRGATLLVHAAVADTVNDQGGNEFYMRQNKLAAKARVSRKAANEGLARLEADGYLERVDELGRGVVVWRFMFKPGRVVFDSRRPATTGNRSSRRRVTTGDRNQPPQVTDDGADVSPPVAQNPREPEPKTEPAPHDGEARLLVEMHWERCKADGRPTPVVKRGRSGSAFMALVGIVRTLLEAGWTEPEITDALWSTEGGHTLQGLGVHLTKRRARAEHDRATSGAVDTRPLWAERPDCGVCGGVGMCFDEASGGAVRCECNPAA